MLGTQDQVTAFGTKWVRSLYKVGMKFVPTWYQVGTKLGTKLEPHWYQDGTKLLPNWYQAGTNSVPNMYILYQCQCVCQVITKFVNSVATCTSLVVTLYLCRYQICTSWFELGGNLILVPNWYLAPLWYQVGANLVPNSR